MSNNNPFHELLHVAGKLAVDMGPLWREQHPEFMDAYEACFLAVGEERVGIRAPRIKRGSEPCQECGQIGFHKMSCDSRGSESPFAAGPGDGIPFPDYVDDLSGYDI